MRETHAFRFVAHNIVPVTDLELHGLWGRLTLLQAGGRDHCEDLLPLLGEYWLREQKYAKRQIDERRDQCKKPC